MAIAVISLTAVIILPDAFAKILSVVITVSTLTILVNLKYSLIEYSGCCLTVRRMNPFTFKRFIRPVVELPFSSIKSFAISNGLITDCIIIKMQSSNSSRCIKINFFLFNKKQILNLENSMNRIIEGEYSPKNVSRIN